MTATRDAHDNARQLAAMAEHLDRLLDSESPYREVVVEEVGGGSRVATMSVGLILDLLAALKGQEEQLTEEEREALREARSWIRTLRRARRDAYVGHLQTELKGQIDAWRWFLEDCAAGERTCAEAYPGEARKRTRIQQLLDEAETLNVDVGEQAMRVRGLDRTLRGMFQPGDYVGPEGREEVFPEDEHWWLYGTPHLPTAT